jgi:hypothetical protein
MSINVIERNVSDCKYVEIFTHCFGSIIIVVIIIIIIIIIEFYNNSNNNEGRSTIK